MNAFRIGASRVSYLGFSLCLHEKYNILMLIFLFPAHTVIMVTKKQSIPLNTHSVSLKSSMAFVYFSCLFCCLLFQPERIDPSASRQGYDVRSDVWSLGITLVSLNLTLMVKKKEKKFLKKHF